MRLARPVQAQGLRPHHIGRDFVAMGVLARVTMTEDGYHLTMEDGSCWLVQPRAQLDYWLTEDDMSASKRAAIERRKARGLGA